MKLSKIALLALKGMGRADRKRVAGNMGVTEDTFYRWMRTNDDSLTKVGYLRILEQELGLTQDQLIESHLVEVQS